MSGDGAPILAFFFPRHLHRAAIRCTRARRSFQIFKLTHAHTWNTRTGTGDACTHARERMPEPATSQPTNRPTNQPASQRGCPHTDRTHAQTRQRVSHGAKRQPTLGSRLARAAAVGSRSRRRASSRCTFTRGPNRPSDQYLLTARRARPRRVRVRDRFTMAGTDRTEGNPRDGLGCGIPSTLAI